MKSKLTLVLLITNLLSLAAVIYLLRPQETVPAKECPKCAQYERRNFYLPTSGFRKYAGTDGDDLGNHWPTYSDSLFLRRGDPFVYVTGQVYAPVDPALDFRPEFLTPGSMNEDSLLWPPTAEVVNNGMFCLHTIPTDTVDMQGGKVKTLRFHPVIRYPQGDTIAEWRDTIEVYVVNKR